MALFRPSEYFLKNTVENLNGLGKHPSVYIQKGLGRDEIVENEEVGVQNSRVGVMQTRLHSLFSWKERLRDGFNKY